MKSNVSFLWTAFAGSLVIAFFSLFVNRNVASVHDMSYTAECVFAFGKNIQTNSCGQVVQPTEYSGGFMEVADRFIYDFRTGWRSPRVVAIFLDSNPSFTNDVAEIKSAVDNAKIELIGWPILTFKISVRSRVREIAIGLASAYAKQISESGGLVGRKGLQEMLDRMESEAQGLLSEELSIERGVADLNASGKRVLSSQKERLANICRKRQLAIETREALVKDCVRGKQLFVQIGDVSCKETE